MDMQIDLPTNATVKTRAPKVMPLERLAEQMRLYRAQGKKVAMCHGCFDLVHPGHMRHFKEAAAQADVLIVTVPD